MRLLINDRLMLRELDFPGGEQLRGILGNGCQPRFIELRRLLRYIGQIGGNPSRFNPDKTGRRPWLNGNLNPFVSPGQGQLAERTAPMRRLCSQMPQHFTQVILLQAANITRNDSRRDFQIANSLGRQFPFQFDLRRPQKPQHDTGEDDRTEGWNHPGPLTLPLLRVQFSLQLGPDAGGCRRQLRQAERRRDIRLGINGGDLSEIR